MPTSIFGDTTVPPFLMKPVAASASPEPPESQGLLERLRAKFSKSAHDLERMRKEVEQDSKKMTRAQKELSRLSTALDNATAAVDRADLHLAMHKAEIEKLETIHLESWGDTGSVSGPGYGPLVALRAAIEDFPRCRAHLAAKVEAARRALKEFEKNSA